MQLQNVVTGSTVSAWFETPPEPEDAEPVLVIEDETGNELCSREGARTFKLLRQTDEEKQRALELGYHFAP